MNETINENDFVENPFDAKPKEETTIPDFIAQLQNEIKQTRDDKLEAEQLARLKEVASIYRGEDKLVSSLDLVELIKSKPPELQMMTGFTGLDLILKGFRLKQLVVLSAATKSGKTSFAIDITSKMREYNPLWLPFEEGAEELVRKFMERNETPPMFFTPENITGNTLKWVEKKIIESIAKYGTQIVFIDHLHFIVPFAAERQDLAIGMTMRALKTMAKKWNICIVLIAHLKKTKVDTSPTLEDLRDSSFIAQEADTVIMLWRESKRENGNMITTNNVNVSVQANRRTGKTGNIPMVYDEGHFKEFDWTTKDEEMEEAFDFGTKS
jgi:replicative DNA helicase